MVSWSQKRSTWPPCSRAASAALLLLFTLPGSCKWSRRPLPRAADAGPKVEWIDPGPGPGPGIDPGRAFAPLERALASVAFVEEHEPDDDRDHAQPIARDGGVRGSLLPPVSGGAGKGDDDYYSYFVQAATASAQELAVTLLPHREDDVSLEIQGGDGARMLLLDEGRAGEREQALGLVVRAGETLYLRVRRSGKAPGAEPGAGAYHLVVAHRPAAPGSEVEPNDRKEQASEAATGTMWGVLQHRKDVDWIALPLSESADAGIDRRAILRIEISSPGATPALRVEAADGAPLLDIKGARQSQALRVRNLGLQAGLSRVLMRISAAGWYPAAEHRYQVRAQLEPPMDLAEEEPNENCERANPLRVEGQKLGVAIAGFLWPGDTDCYRLMAPAEARIRLKLLLPSGEPGCEALLSRGGEKGSEISGIDASADPFVRVVAGSDSCFDAPYQLAAAYE